MRTIDEQAKELIENLKDYQKEAGINGVAEWLTDKVVALDDLMENEVGVSGPRAVLSLATSNLLGSKTELQDVK